MVEHGGTLTLDFGDAASPALLENLSGCAFAGDILWTVSDEGRSLERLVRAPDGFRLAEQFRLDDLVADIPGAEEGDELDLESLEIGDGRLWLAGSHCRVRKKPATEGVLNPKLRDRPSRHLLACFNLKANGARLGKVRCLPFVGKGSLRHHLAGDRYLQPFLDLASKENGLDIEGLAVRRGKVLLGLRGPVIDSFAIVVELTLDDDFAIAAHELHFLDLKGLGIRELATTPTSVLLIAGPVAEAHGPFHLYRWVPMHTPAIQAPELIHTFAANGEKPEGLALRAAIGPPELLVLCDRPDGQRIDGSVYTADFLKM